MSERTTLTDCREASALKLAWLRRIDPSLLDLPLEQAMRCAPLTLEWLGIKNVTYPDMPTSPTSEQFVRMALWHAHQKSVQLNKTECTLDLGEIDLAGIPNNELGVT